MAVTLTVWLCVCIGNACRQELIEAGTNLDAVDWEGNTVLVIASFEGNIGMVKLLHEAKADLNVCSRYGTALHLAMMFDFTEVLKVTLNKRVRNAFVFALIWPHNQEHP